MKTNDYIETIQKMNGWSYYRIAQNLGIGQSTISHYKKGTRFFDDETAIKVAEYLDINPEIVLADIHAERAKVRKTKEVWQSIAKALRATTATVIFTALFLATSYESVTYSAGYVHQCILCKIGLLLVICLFYPLRAKLLNHHGFNFINLSYDLYNIKRSPF